AAGWPGTETAALTERFVLLAAVPSQLFDRCTARFAGALPGPMIARGEADRVSPCFQGGTIMSTLAKAADHATPDLKNSKLFRQQCYMDGAWLDAESGK